MKHLPALALVAALAGCTQMMQPPSGTPIIGINEEAVLRIVARRIANAKINVENLPEWAAACRDASDLADSIDTPLNTYGDYISEKCQIIKQQAALGEWQPEGLAPLVSPIPVPRGEG